MQHKEITLKNGLRIVLVPMPDLPSVTIMKGYNIGSRHEPDKLAGAAHFIEHLMFKGTQRRPTPREIVRELDRVGAQYNAFTGKDMTAYYIKVASRHFELAVDMLSDMTYNATFPAEELEREKGVIIEEIKLYEDNPSRYIDDIFEQAAYEGGTLGNDIIGSRESIRAMTRDDLLKFRDSFYTDSNAVLVVAGNIPQNAEETLSKAFHKEGESNGEFSKNYDKYTEEQDGLRLKLHTKQVEQVHLQLGFRCKGFAHEDSAIYNVMTAALGGGMSSVLFDEVREKRGLCYYIRMYPDLYEDVGYLAVRAGLNKEKVEEAIEVILGILRDVRENGIDDDEIVGAKEFISGNIALDLEDSANRAELYLKRYLITGEIRTPEEKIAEIQAVTKDDIIRVARETFVDSRLVCAMITDQTDPEQYRPLLSIEK